jgi:hypothetical protein
MLSYGGGNAGSLTMDKEWTTTYIESVRDEHVEKYRLTLNYVVLRLEVFEAEMLREGDTEFLETFGDGTDRFPGIEFGFDVEIEPLHHSMSDATEFVVCEVKVHLFGSTVTDCGDWHVGSQFSIVDGCGRRIDIAFSILDNWRSTIHNTLISIENVDISPNSSTELLVK